MTSRTSTRTYPPTRAHGITTFDARARTAPASYELMRPHAFDTPVDQREKKFTQEEQDVEDEKARKRAMKNLVSSWQERLQLISVITTFFASTEAAMLVNTKPVGMADLGNNVLKVANASLLGALIFHVYASVLSFLGAFLLISYKLREARREELIAEGMLVTSSPVDINDAERGSVDPGLHKAFTSNSVQSVIMHMHARHDTTATVPEQTKEHGVCAVEQPVFSANPHVEQVVSYLSHASSHRLLSRTHALCVFLAAIGFVLAIVGILCYTWALNPRSVSIFASACLGAALLTMIALCI